MRSARSTFPSDLWLYIETARSIGADEAELASIVGSLRERSQSGAPSDTVQALLAYARQLATHVANSVHEHQLSLPLEIVATSRRLCKELDWIEQDVLTQQQLWQAMQAPGGELRRPP